MNKPYTCHQCGTVFDALDSEEHCFVMGAPLGPVTNVQVTCPGCYDAGFLELSSRTFILDVSKGAAELVTT